jgi:tripartite-type tricarboxylate transporter receptor subunit TctC
MRMMLRPGYEMSTWAGIGAPKDTPPEVIDRLNCEINAGLSNPLGQHRAGDGVRALPAFSHRMLQT